MDWYLDRSIDLKEYLSHEYGRDFIDLKPEGDKAERIMISRFFATDTIGYGNIVHEFLKTKSTDEDVKVIDVIKYLSTLNLKDPFIAMCNAYISEYNKMIELGDEYASPSVISYLKTQLESLISSRDDLDKQISVLQNKIEYLSSKGSNGGVKL
jgi:hypothetical protein